MNTRRAGFITAVAVAFLALALTSPSLRGGFATDDHFIRATFKGFPGIPEYAHSRLDTFVFSNGDEQRNRALMDRGVFPWWSDPGARLAFWRPLASLSHLADFRLWKNNAVPMHLENMLWYALLCALLCVLYRRLLGPPWVALFAAILFTVNENNGSAVAWLANRNQLMAAVCIVLVLLVHDAWRRDGKRWGAVLGPLFLAAGFFCAEAVVAACAYLFAYALFIDEGKWLRRFMTLVPYGCVFVLWNLFYRRAGFGSAGSGWYTDPASDPAGFFRVLVNHLPTLLIDLFYVWPGPLTERFDASHAYLIKYIFAAIFLVTGWVLYPLLKRNPVARFWLLGMVLSLIPVAAVIPQPRVVLIGAMGFAPLLAQYLSAWATPRQWLYFAVGLVVCAATLLLVGVARLPLWGQAALIGVVLSGLIAAACLARRNAEWMPRRWSWRVPAFVLAIVWVAGHVIAAPIALPGTSTVIGTQARKMERSYATLPSNPDVKSRTLVILKAATDFMPWHFSLIRASLEIPFPGRLRVLCCSGRDLTVERSGPDTLVLHAKTSLIGDPTIGVFRGTRRPMKAGEEVVLAGMTARVLSVDGNGMPKDVAFRFDKPLEDGSLEWWTVAYVPVKLRTVNRYIESECYVPISPPRPGETVALSALVEASPGYRALTARKDTPSEPGAPD